MTLLTRLSFLGVLTFALTGCYLTQTADTPMPTVFYPAKEASEYPRLIVFLPGFGDGPERFLDEGMVAIVREVAPDFAVVAANAHFAYYRDQSIVVRLRADVIGPEIENYREIWLVGVSMGGAGATSYLMAHSDDVAGLILLAPYLGDQPLIEDIAAAGGLRQWELPPLETIGDAETRHFHELWGWLAGADGETLDKIFIGYGSEDPLRHADGLLAAVLDQSAVQTAPGGHKWTVWRVLFRELLERATANRE